MKLRNDFTGQAGQAKNEYDLRIMKGRKEKRLTIYDLRKCGRISPLGERGVRWKMIYDPYGQVLQRRFMKKILEIGDSNINILCIISVSNHQ